MGGSFLLALDLGFREPCSITGCMGSVFFCSVDTFVLYCVSFVRIEL